MSTSLARESCKSHETPWDPFTQCVRAVFARCLIWRELHAKTLQIAKADARTRTGDPFITSYGQLSPRAIASRLRPLCSAESPDWRCLLVT